MYRPTPHFLAALAVLLTVVTFAAFSAPSPLQVIGAVRVLEPK